uniref:K+ potassium transporter C-terminal domain-containing protein n=1 Tax=Zooxanthella nutricula TaxID=1333877 RepID=A0A7S2L5Q5_9DINO
MATLLGCLPNTIVLLSVSFENVPFISEEHRAAFKALSSGVFSVVLHFGYAEPLVAEKLSVHKALARLAREHCEDHPGLLSLTTLDQESAASRQAIRLDGMLPDGPNDAKTLQLQDEASAAELGAVGGGSADAGATDLRGSTFVVSKVHYACLPDARHGAWNRFRAALYRAIEANARQPIRFLGLEGEEAIEVSVVRFL